MPYKPGRRVQTNRFMHSASDYYGTWEVWKQEYMVKVDESAMNATLNGTVFELDETEEVTWTVPPTVEFIPLFKAEMYQIRYNEILFYLPCGDDIKFSVDLDDRSKNLILRYKRKLRIHCKKVQYEEIVLATYKLLSTLEDESFHDLVISSSTGQQFKVHKCILYASFPEIEWDSNPPPLSSLPSHIISVILAFVYSGFLPTDESSETLNELKTFVAKTEGYNILREELDKWQEVNEVKKQVTTLTDDFHERLMGIAKMIHGNPRLDESVSKTHLCEPSKLLYTLKEGFREMVIGCAGQIQMMYIYTTRERELTKKEKKEIIKIIARRSNDFLVAMRILLETLHKHLAAIPKEDLNELAQYLLKDVENGFNKGSELFEEFKSIIENVLRSTNQKHKKGKKKKPTAKLSRIMKNALHIKELSKLKEVEEAIVRAIVMLSQRSEQFYELTPDKKITFMIQFTSHIIHHNLPNYMISVDKIPIDVDDKSSYKEFKYVFQYLASYVKWCLDKCHENIGVLAPSIEHLRKIVDREEFDDILADLGLLPAPTPSDTSKPSSYNLAKRCQENVQRTSVLPQCMAKLYESQKHSDLEFLVREQCSICGARLDPCEHVMAESIAAHRVIVASRCTWFKRALESGMKESIDRTFHIEECSPRLFRLFLVFLYYGSVDLKDISTEDLTELMLLADKYEVGDLHRVCQNELVKTHLTDESVLILLSFAENMSATKLKDAALLYVRHNPGCVTTEEFNQLSPSSQEEVKRVLDEESSRPPKSECELSLERITREILANPVTDSESESDSDISTRNNDSLSSAEASPNMDSEDRIGLNEFLRQVKAILGSEVKDEDLVKLALAADNDVSRAVNFYFEGGLKE